MPADGRTVVSETALQGLMGEFGQGATIMTATGGAKPASGGQARHRRRHSQDDATPSQ
jgi:hypothetical protein